MFVTCLAPAESPLWMGSIRSTAVTTDLTRAWGQVSVTAYIGRSDVRYFLRRIDMLLRKSAVVALCLALGAGSASAQFTVGTLALGPPIGLGGLGPDAGRHLAGRTDSGLSC